MKLNLTNSLIVVEGTTDINYLCSFIDALFYSVNGSAINENDIEFIKKVSETHNIIILTDPDFPGMQIRNKINAEIKGCYNAFVRKEHSIKKNKVGVAECDKDEVINALSNLKLFKNNSDTGNLKLSDLYELGLSGKQNSKELRIFLSNELHIGYCNTKQFLTRINCLNISKDELKEIIKNA